MLDFKTPPTRSSIKPTIGRIMGKWFIAKWRCASFIISVVIWLF
jgi:hypothetical protein